MIVVDSSIIVAIIREESDAAIWVDVLDKTLEETLSILAISTHAVDLQQGIFAREAFIRFGRGRHPAALNFGDCFAYALAKTRDEPLLFKGDDFAKTDIVPAWRP